MSWKENVQKTVRPLKALEPPLMLMDPRDLSLDPAQFCEVIITEGEGEIETDNVEEDHYVTY